MERLSSYEADRLNDALYGMDKDGVEQTQVSARYVRTDPDGMAWVRFEGADKDTPLTSAMSVRARDGDLIDVSLGGYEAVGGGNRTDPSAGFQDVRAVTVEVEHVKGKQAEFEKVTAQELEADKARIGQLEADSAEIEELVAQKATIAELEAAEGRITSLESDHVSTTDLQAVNGEITNLKAKDATIEGNITAATGRIGTIEADYLKAADMTAEQARVNNLLAGKATVNDLNAATGRITVLESTKANIADIEANYITADDIEATYMHADMTNSDVAWIQNGVIANGAISSAMINDVSANKLTAGTINGSVINVTNLNADNITTGTINGQRIGEGSLSLDKLSDDVYTESEVDAKLATMQAEIDGAIETWTGTEVPTLGNAPASNWSDSATRDTHVGDVYFVVNSQSQQNGYNYRFTKTGSTYSWQLIKDNDVTNALQRLETAEGKITQFDSDISTLKTDTGTLTTRTTSLETRADGVDSALLDKVDTTDFNELSDTVDGHTQTLSQHTTAISNKADGSTVTALTTRVSKNEQDISGINTTIGELQTTVESKADGSALTTVSNRLNTVSDTVDSHTQTISSVQDTLATKADGSTVETLTTRVSDVEQDVSGFKTTVSETYATKTEAKQTDSASGQRELPTTDASELPMLGLTVHGECSQDGTTTPDAPVPVRSVRGRNLLNPTYWCNLKYNNNAGTVFQKTDVPSTYTVSDESITVGIGTAWYGVTIVSDELTEGKTYTLNGMISCSTPSSIRVSVYVLDSDYAVTRRLLNYATARVYSAIQSITIAEGESRVAVAFGSTTVGDTLTFRMPQLEEGAYTTPYTPYGKISVKAHGKNFANDRYEDYFKSLSTYYLAPLDLEIGKTYYARARVRDGKELPTAYTVAAWGYGDNYAGNIPMYIIANASGVRNQRFTVPDTWTAPKLAVDVGGVPNDKEKFDSIFDALEIQLEEGTEATEYEPYRESVSYIDLKGEELCSLPDGTEDVLKVDASGHAVVEKNTATVTLDGANNELTFTFGKLDGYLPYFYASDTQWAAAGYPLPKHYGTQSANILCDTLPVRILEDYKHTTETGVQLWPDPSASFLFNADTGGTYQISAHSWFAEHPMTLTYPLAEPRTVDLGYVDLSTTFPNGIVHVEAEIQPVIDGSWWTAAGYEAGRAYSEGSTGAELSALTERVTTAESTITQQAGEIALKANAADVNTKAETTALLEVKANKATLTSEVNASADTVKIDAARVNIEGAAIFTSGRLSQSSLDVAYDASGAASAAQAAAISAAAADATSKANAAQAAATNAANQATDQKLTSYSTTSQMNTAIGDAVDAIEVGGRNLYLIKDSVPGFLAGSGSSIASPGTATKERTSAFIPVVPGDLLMYQAWMNGGGPNNFWMAYTFYTDEDMTTAQGRPALCSGLEQPNGYYYNSYGPIKVPSTAAYIRISFRTYGDYFVKLERGNKATDWAPAPEDINANAVKRTQRIYYRKSASGAPTTPGSWVTNGNADSGWTKYNAWSTRIPPIAESNAEGATKYLYLYTCEQREMADGTLAYTTVLLDDSTTVIDGGNIITGSVAANKLDVYDATIQKIRADAIDAASITIGQSQVTGLTSTLDGKASTTDVANAAKRTYVSIRATAIDYAADTATLEATLYTDGVATTTGVTYAWLMDGTAISGATSRTYSVPASSGLSHAYSCKATW